MCKMQVNRHTKQNHLCQFNIMSYEKNLALGFRNPITMQTGILIYRDQFKSSNLGFGKKEY